MHTYTVIESSTQTIIASCTLTQLLNQAHINNYCIMHTYTVIESSTYKQLLNQVAVIELCTLSYEIKHI